MRTCALLFVILFLTSCVTFVEHPGRHRRQHPQTVGVDIESSGLGILVHTHHGEHIALRTALNKKFRNSQTINIADDASHLNLDQNNTSMDREVFSESEGLSFGILYYPWRTSSFFLGTQSNVKHYSTAYSEQTSDGNPDASTTNIEWRDYAVELALPIGMAKSAENGTTWILALSPTYRVFNQRQFVDDGSSDQVNEQFRESALLTMEKKRRFAWNTVAGVGFSF